MGQLCKDINKNKKIIKKSGGRKLQAEGATSGKALRWKYSWLVYVE